MSSSPLRSEDAAETQPTLVPAHGNGVLKPFQPGQSGNPSGKGGLYHEVQRLCREASPAAMRRLIELMSSTDERVAIMAADKVLERAWGKAKEMPDPPPDDPDRHKWDSSALRKFLDLINSFAVPAPLYEVEAEQSQRAPSAREMRRPALVTNPPPPDTWPA